MQYKFLPHTADAKFQAFGKSMDEAFSSAALAMTSIMVDHEAVKPAMDEEIAVEGSDLKALLYNFLEELLFLFETKGFLLHDMKGLTILKNGQYSLKATASGDMNLDQYEMMGEVKAITYNEMEITEGETVTLQVVVDL
jgi:SHS2 domain-containing protein